MDLSRRGSRVPPEPPAVECIVGILQIEADKVTFEAFRDGLLNLELEA